MSAQQSWKSLYLAYQPYLISLCYRLLGSLAEAEEIVQETFLEGQKLPATSINNPRAWLVKVCTNKALSHLESAYKRRESYPGTWLPEALPQSFHSWDLWANQHSPEQELLLSESLSLSFLLMAEKLSAEQRASFLLHDIFGFSFAEVAQLLEKSIASCRKAAQRARQQLQEQKDRFEPPPKDAQKRIFQLYRCAQKGDREGLAECLTSSPELWGDGGGKVFAAGYICGLEESIQFLEKVGAIPIFVSDNYRQEYISVNARPGLVISRKNALGLFQLDTVLSYEFQQGKIATIYAQRSPDKLDVLVKSRSASL